MEINLFYMQFIHMRWYIFVIEATTTCIWEPLSSGTHTMSVNLYYWHQTQAVVKLFLGALFSLKQTTESCCNKERTSQYAKTNPSFFAMEGKVPLPSIAIGSKIKWIRSCKCGLRCMEAQYCSERTPLIFLAAISSSMAITNKWMSKGI